MPPVRTQSVAQLDGLSYACSSEAIDVRNLVDSDPLDPGIPAPT